MRFDRSDPYNCIGFGHYMPDFGFYASESSSLRRRRYELAWDMFPFKEYDIAANRSFSTKGDIYTRSLYFDIIKHILREYSGDLHSPIRRSAYSLIIGRSRTDALRIASSDEYVNDGHPNNAGWEEKLESAYNLATRIYEYDQSDFLCPYLMFVYRNCQREALRSDYLGAYWYDLFHKHDNRSGWLGNTRAYVRNGTKD